MTKRRKPPARNRLAQALESLYEQFRMKDPACDDQGGAAETAMHFVCAGWNFSELGEADHGRILDHAIDAYDRPEEMRKQAETLGLIVRDIAAAKQKLIGTTGKAVWGLQFDYTAPEGNRIAKLEVCDSQQYARYLRQQSNGTGGPVAMGKGGD